MLPLIALTLLTVQETQPEPPTRQYAACVLLKVGEWAKSTETAQVIVDTAMGACEEHRAGVRKQAAQYVQENAKDIKAGDRMPMVEAMVADTEKTIRNVAFQNLIKLRTPKP